MFDAGIFEKVDETFLQRVVAQQTSESQTLDLKRDAYPKTDEGKKEFLKDVSSFANTEGGFLVLGIDEKDGAAASLTPLQNLNADDETMRLENLARDCIEPRVQGMRIRAVAVHGGHVLLIHIPKSWNPPHRVSFKKSGLFFGRNSAASYPLDIQEIRRRFLMASELEQRARNFIHHRIQLIQQREIELPLPHSLGFLVLHLVPLGPDPSQESANWIAPMTDNQLMNHFKPMRSHANSWRTNLEGLMFYRGGDESHGYTQIFRSGAVEATSFSITSRYDAESTPYVGSVHTTGLILNNTENYLQGMVKVGVTPPVLVSATLHGVQGTFMHLGSGHLDKTTFFNRDSMPLPAVVFDSIPQVGETSKILKPMLDTLWQAYGYTECGLLDEHGVWVCDSHYTQY